MGGGGESEGEEGREGRERTEGGTKTGRRGDWDWKGELVGGRKKGGRKTRRKSSKEEVKARGEVEGGEKKTK